MNKVFSMKDTKVDDKGKKTTITIQTEDPAVIRNLLDNPGVGSKSKTGNTSKAKASTKKTSSDKKKDSIKAEVREVKPKTKKTGSKKAAKPKALPAPKAKSKSQKSKSVGKEKTVGKKASDTGFVPKDETIIFHKGKWVITKKPIGGLFTYSLYEKDYCRTQLIFMPDDDKKALKELKNNMREEFF